MEELVLNRPFIFKAIEWLRTVFGYPTDFLVKILPLWALRPIPDTLSYLRPAFGYLSVYYYVNGLFLLPVLLQIAAGFTDFYDGDFARKITKRFPKRVVSAFGETLDPTCDKALVVVNGFANYFFFVAAIPEYFSYRFSSRIRNGPPKEHIIALGSKVATVVQCVFMAIFFAYDSLAWKIAFAVGVFGCSCARAMVYWFELKKRIRNGTLK